MSAQPSASGDRSRSRSQFVELGASGVDTRSVGYVVDEIMPQLRGEKLVRVLREMSDNDSVVGAILFAIDQRMRASTWWCDPAEGDTDPTLAEFVNQCMTDMSLTWPDTLSAVQTMLPYGWAALEIVLKRRGGGGEGDPANVRSQFEDNLIGWRKWALRPQDTLHGWDFDESGGVNGMWQTAPPSFRPVYIPIQRLALFRTTAATGNPEGRSILRNAWKDWYYKTRIQQVEAIGIDRDLAGLPVGRVPYRLLTDDATEAEKAAVLAMKKTIRSIRRDENEGVLWPNDVDEFGNRLYDLELLSTGGRRQFDTDKTIVRYDQRMTMTILADFIMLGHERVGTQALSVSKIELFTQALEAWMDMIAAVINRYLIPRLLRANGMDERRAPQLRYSGVAKTDLEELGNFIDKVSGAGMPLFPDVDFETYVREAAGWPALTEEQLEAREEEEDPDDEDPRGEREDPDDSDPDPASQADPEDEPDEGDL